jgi:hypothetical protein
VFGVSRSVSLRFFSLLFGLLELCMIPCILALAGVFEWCFFQWAGGVG